MSPLDKLRPQPDARLAFLQGFLRKPQQVGSVIPSSRFLERRLVAASGARHARLLVELGPGTGGTTRALLHALPPDGTLLAIELEPRFAAILREGSAEHLAEALRQHGLGTPDTVISGIPFSTMDAALGRRIAKAIHDALGSGGRFVAYQVRGKVHDVAKPCFGRAEIDVELRNIPPMRIYRWRKGERRGHGGALREQSA
jgi:phosphatidylethanolamine/phosphatidyl-N-methylethanolamine N-methyltransferase